MVEGEFFGKISEHLADPASFGNESLTVTFERVDKIRNRQLRSWNWNGSESSCLDINVAAMNS